MIATVLPTVLGGTWLPPQMVMCERDRSDRCKMLNKQELQQTCGLETLCCTVDTYVKYDTFLSIAAAAIKKQFAAFGSEYVHVAPAAASQTAAR